MRINTNIASMTAQENASNVNKNLSTSLEKLSSGLRINKAADDASGMSIADKLRTQASSLGQGISNANSANALVQIADKAMAEQSNILDIVKTKLIQASTSTTSAEGREAIRKDVTKLLDQLDNIANQTNYNGINLLNTAGQELSFQVGESSDFDINLKTAYAANTAGLGATEVVNEDASAVVKHNGAVTIDEKDSSVNVQFDSTVTASGSKAVVINGEDLSTSGAEGDISFDITGATNVRQINLAATNGSTIDLSTDDAALKDTLNTLAASNNDLTMTSDGNYTLKVNSSGQANLNFGTEKVDISSLSFSGVQASNTSANKEVITVITDDALDVTKTGGSYGVSLNSTDATISAANTDDETVTQSTAAASAGGPQATTVTVSDLEAVGDTFSMTIDGTDFSYSMSTADAASSAGGRLTAIKDAINDAKITDTDAGLITATISGSDIVLTGATDNKAFTLDALSVSNSGGGFVTTSALAGKLTGSGISDDAGISYSTSGVTIDEGSATIKADPNGTYSGSKGVSVTTVGSADSSYTVNADQVQRLALASGSVTLTTDDAATRARLDSIAELDDDLTKITEGAYTFAGSNAILDFGAESKLDVRDLKITGAAAAEILKVQTDEAVSVTKQGTAASADITLQAVDIKADGTSGTEKALSQNSIVASISNTLAELKAVGENELTSDIANSFMSVIDEALNQLNTLRSDFGSTQNQLDSAIRNMMTTQTNIKAAESVIRDVDYAAESANFNKQNIIAQAGTYAMSQANAVQQNVMRLLQ